MTVDHVFAVVAVSNFDTSHDWYQRLFDTPATNVPMPGNLAE
jgi:4-hydroxyphenylpyruvate dioxygenase-like putative hemolysin